MEKRHRCRLCCRSFGNGRALGGHMRSHMMKFYAENKAAKHERGEGNPFYDFQSAHSYSSTTSSFEEEEDEEEEEEVKGPNLVDHDFSIAAGSVVLVDGESETESSKKNPICRRSKRVRSSRISGFINRFSMKGFFQVKKSKLGKEGKSNANEYSSVAEPEPLSSISDTTPEEHVAHCLMMLSRDKWSREEAEQGKEEEHEQEQEEGEARKYGHDYSEEAGVVKVVKPKVGGKYRCEACDKLFRSYQALGGHRASHKKTRVNAAEKIGPDASSAAGPKAVEEKIHECPFCHRNFSSGQALGGHKRSHFISGGAVTSKVSPVKQSPRTGETLNIDLNLPAPTEDDVNSQNAASAVSDAEFVNPIKQS